MYSVAYRNTTNYVRDIKRRIEVVKKKMKDLQAMGLPCAFVFVAPWSGGLVFNDDARFTNVMADMPEKFMAAIGEKEDQSSGKEIILGPLPGPLLDLNMWTLQSIVIAIRKDLQVDWSRVVTQWWPEHVPFCNPRVTPPTYRGIRIFS